MIEVFLCSLITIVPDYLLRRFLQGKRIGIEITLFSVWHELRWGITLCAILTVSLITVIFYYHPTTDRVTSAFRTVTLLSENAGRVAEVYVENNQDIEAGTAIFKLDDSRQRAAVETARRQVAEVDAAMPVVRAELASAVALLNQAEAAYQQTFEELDRKQTLKDKGSAAVSDQEVDRLENLLGVRQGAVDAAIANQQAVEIQIETQLPAQRESALSALAEAEIELAKQTVYAGVDGRLEQFALKPGDIVNPILRPAGVMVPAAEEERRFQAGFDQITSLVIKPGMLAEITCASLPFTIVPMVVVDIQDVIATGQIRPSDQLVQIGDGQTTGSITVYLEALYKGGADQIPRGSQCVANAYSSFHELLKEEDLPLQDWLFYHVVDTVAAVHAAILRIHALIFPVELLVLSGH